MACSRSDAERASRPAAVIAPAALSDVIAFSTFDHAVFWVSTAPTATSNGVSPGHQCCGPQAAASCAYTRARFGSACVLMGSLRQPTHESSRARGPMCRTRSELERAPAVDNGLIGQYPM